MKLNIPDELSVILKEIGEIGGKNVYLVGGAVRDIILNNPTFDIDIVVEGNAIDVAKELQRHWNGTLQEHPQFGTATVTTDGSKKLKVDFVTARCETYQKPATLPNVKHGHLSDDLTRRDFTINSIAMRLEPKDFGKVVDTTGGVNDLKTGIIRTHHIQSYIDDPTRIFRACRYAGRYNFRIDQKDNILIKEAIQNISKLSGERIRNEIDRILREENVARIINLLVEYGVFEVILPETGISTLIQYDYLSAQKAIIWASKHIKDENFSNNILRWMVLCGTGRTNGLSPFLIEAISFKLVLEHQLHKVATQKHSLQNVTENASGIRKVFQNNSISISDSSYIQPYNGKWCIIDTENQNTYVYHNNIIYNVRTPLTSYRTLSDILDTLDVAEHPSQIYELLNPYPIETIVLAYSNVNISNSLKQKIGAYLIRWRLMKPMITGNDLIKWGEKPGKTIPLILKDLFAAQLDGLINSKSEAYVRFKTIKNKLYEQMNGIR